MTNEERWRIGNLREEAARNFMCVTGRHCEYLSLAAPVIAQPIDPAEQTRRFQAWIDGMKRWARNPGRTPLPGAGK